MAMADIEKFISPLLLLEFHGSEADVAEQSRNFSEIAKECGGGDFTWTTRLAAPGSMFELVVR
jgi:hypothetical protein